MKYWPTDLLPKSRIKLRRRQVLSEEAKELKPSLPQHLQLAMDLAMEEGASSWLMILLLEEHRFALHMRAFRDAISLRYGWPLEQIPVNCTCGAPFPVQHALSCSKGGYPSIRHNEVRDLNATC